MSDLALCLATLKPQGGDSDRVTFCLYVSGQELIFLSLSNDGSRVVVLIVFFISLSGVQG